MTPLHQRGMTLIEATVWIGMFLFAMITIASSVIYFYRVTNYTLEEATAITSAQRGIDTLMQEIREATYASDGSYPIRSIAANDFSFYAEVDGDVGVERVHYYVQGTNLYRGILNPSGDPAVYTGTETVTQISDNVRNLSLGVTTFAYYDGNGALITNMANIGSVRFITTTLSVNVDPNRLPSELVLKSSAALRNLLR